MLIKIGEQPLESIDRLLRLTNSDMTNRFAIRKTIIHIPILHRELSPEPLVYESNASQKWLGVFSVRYTSQKWLDVFFARYTSEK